MSNIISLFILFLYIKCEEIIYNHTNEENNLYFVLTTFRHGARTNFLFIDSFWNTKFKVGELTKYGEQQHLEIGKKYRNRYSNFLNMSYDKNQMYIRSSDSKRVIISTEKELEGFFNKKIDSNGFDLIRSGLNSFNMYTLNNEIREEMKKYEKFCDKRRLDDNFYRKKFKDEINPILKECYNTKFTISLHVFCDNTISSYYQYTYENDTENKIGKCGKETANKIYQFCYDWYNSFRGWNEYEAYMFYIFYQYIFDYMNKAIKGTGPVKMIMIGGHETNIAEFMDFLDGLKIIERTVYPDFAFNIIIELRKYTNDYYLEIYYNDTLKYNNTLKTFQNLLNKSKYSNLYNYCGIPPWKEKEVEKFNDSNLIKYETIINKETEIINNTKEIKNEMTEIYNIDKNKNKNKNDTRNEQNIINENEKTDIIINMNETEENKTVINENIESNLIMMNNTMENKTHELNFDDKIKSTNDKNTVKKYFLKLFKSKKNLKLYIIIVCMILIILFILFLFILVCKSLKKKKQFIDLKEEKKTNSNNNLSVVSLNK